MKGTEAWGSQALLPAPALWRAGRQAGASPKGSSRWDKMGRAIGELPAMFGCVRLFKAKPFGVAQGGRGWQGRGRVAVSEFRSIGVLGWPWGVPPSPRLPPSRYALWRDRTVGRDGTASWRYDGTGESGGKEPSPRPNPGPLPQAGEGKGTLTLALSRRRARGKEKARQAGLEPRPVALNCTNLH